MTITRGFNVPLAISLLKQADIIIIDVDSTVIRNEGIDILARFVKKENEITLGELNGVNEFVEKFSKKGNISLKEIFWGLSVRDEKGSKCRVTLIATGFTLDDVCDWHLYEREKNKPSTDHAPIIDLDDWA